MTQEAQQISNNPKKPRKFNYHVGQYAVQCGKCFKWRQIPTKEQFETIREKFIENPWFCNKNPDVSCDDPGTLEFDNSRIWIIDKPNIPKPPAGFDRKLIMRKNFIKTDAFYITPTGKRVRAPSEVKKFLEAKPEYRDRVSVCDFNFTVPKLMDPRNMEAKGSSRKGKASEREDD